MLALVAGIILALAALGFVLYPIFIADATVASPRRAPANEPEADEGDPALAALREIEFDRATGKLSDEDYASLKSRYTVAAVAAMRVADANAEVSADSVEALIDRFKARMSACPDCGPRPEPDAAYCSSCGRFLPGKCAHCGAAVNEVGARYCSGCGSVLAA